jgi:hypothetical protein
MSTRLTSVYAKPLVKGLDESPERALRRLQQSVLYRIRREIFQSTYSDRAKRAFAKAVKVEVKESSLTIRSTHPGFTNMIRGRKRRQMKWLTKAIAPIPIITEDGELIFRTATIKSMRDGKWIHPSRQPMDFLDRVKKDAKEQIRKSIVAEMRRVVKNASKKTVRL